MMDIGLVKTARVDMGLAKTARVDMGLSRMTVSGYGAR